MKNKLLTTILILAVGTGMFFIGKGVGEKKLTDMIIEYEKLETDYIDYVDEMTLFLKDKKMVDQVEVDHFINSAKKSIPGVNTTARKSTYVEWIYPQANVQNSLDSKFKRESPLAYLMGSRLLGMAFLDSNRAGQGQPCIIVAPEPNGEHDTHRMEILGHELYHCMVGDFHK